MSRTTTIYYLNGFSKAKTPKAVLFFDPHTNREAWIPTSISTVKFTGPEYRVKVSVPDWFFNKISWSSVA